MRSQILKLLGISAAAIFALSANPAMAHHHHHRHHHHQGKHGHTAKMNDDCPTTNPNCHLDPHPKVL